MKMKLRHTLLGLTMILATTIVTGCNTDNAPKELAPEQSIENKPSVVKESSIPVEKDEKLIVQTGFLHGFPEKNLVEFKVEQDTSEVLRIFNMEKEIASYLVEEEQDGNTEFLITYKESKDGIKPPVLVKIEKK